MAEGWEQRYERKLLDRVVFTYVVRITKVLVPRVLFDQLTCLLPWHSERYLDGDKTYTHIPNHIKLFGSMSYYICNILDKSTLFFYREWKCNIEIVEKFKTAILFLVLGLKR